MAKTKLNPNAKAQAAWRKKHSDTLRRHRAIRPAFARLLQSGSEHWACELAKELRAALGAKNTANLSRFLADPKLRPAPTKLDEFLSGINSAIDQKRATRPRRRII